MREYEFVGGPLHGTRRNFSEGADWFGFEYLEGEYNTIVTKTYAQEPPQLFWRLKDDPPIAPDWVYEGPYGEAQALEDHVKRLLDGQQG